LMVALRRSLVCMVMSSRVVGALEAPPVSR
jgi:hypothetical protein